MKTAPRPSRNLSIGAQNQVRVSFEVFPPKNDAMAEALGETMARLAPLGPTFVSVTCGAGGSTTTLTSSTVDRIMADTGVPVAAHLTCASASRHEIDETVAAYAAAGVERIVALRGDSQAGIGQPFQAHADGYQGTPDLVRAIKGFGLDVSVSAYPEKHPESPTFGTDLDMLAAKVDAGADRALTQFFFDNDVFYRYLDQVRARGIDIPIVPGILPLQNFIQARSFAERCGASIPAWLADRFEGLDDDLDTRQKVAVAVAVEQVLDLVDHGVTDFHFFTMNRAELVYPICHLLGLRPQVKAVVKVMPPPPASLACSRQPRNGFWCSTVPWAP
jgi:methylenetetrahydrofolate reductase (NADPH)